MRARSGDSDSNFENHDGGNVEQFFQRDILITNQISYNEALEEVVNILVDGITR